MLGSILMSVMMALTSVQGVSVQTASPAFQQATTSIQAAQAVARQASRPVQLPVLRRGDGGPFVIMLQSLLGVRPLDGFFGNRTLVAVKSFQRREGLSPTGIVGNNTWRALTSGSWSD